MAGVRGAGCGVRGAGCGVRGAGCGVRGAGCGVCCWNIFVSAAPITYFAAISLPTQKRSTTTVPPDSLFSVFVYVLIFHTILLPSLR